MAIDVRCCDGFGDGEVLLVLDGWTDWGRWSILGVLIWECYGLFRGFCDDGFGCRLVTLLLELLLGTTLCGTCC